MSTTVLLIVWGVCTLAIVAALAYAGRQAWRLAKTGGRVAGASGTAARQIGARAALASAKASALAANTDGMTAALAKLQASLKRVDVLTQALGSAREPWESLLRLKR